MSEVLQITPDVRIIRADFMTDGMVVTVRTGSRAVCWMNRYTFQNYTGMNNAWIRHLDNIMGHSVLEGEVQTAALASGMIDTALLPLDKVDDFILHLVNSDPEELPLAMFVRVWINRYYEITDADHQAIDAATRDLFELALA